MIDQNLHGSGSKFPAIVREAKKPFILAEREGFAPSPLKKPFIFNAPGGGNDPRNRLSGWHFHGTPFAQREALEGPSRRAILPFPTLTRSETCTPA
jgi:hypothetical protein